jgi:protein gp37
MKDSAIQWTDHTFNPWIGCTKVSPGCANCYAAVSVPAKMRGIKWGKGEPRQRTSAAYWKQPLAWNKFPLGRVRPRVFCASLADWLDNEVPIAWLADLLKLIHDTPNLDWLLLSKRPENWKDRIVAALNHLTGERDQNPSAFENWLDLWQAGADAPDNVWLGTTVENQEMADHRIPELLKIPARVRFLSCEPLLGAVDLRHVTSSTGEWLTITGRIDWVIVGGESGPGARPFNIDWARDIVKQCMAADVAPFVKQLGSMPVCDCSIAVESFSANCCYHFPNPIRDKKGGDINEFPDDLRIRQFPDSAFRTPHSALP